MRKWFAIFIWFPMILNAEVIVSAGKVISTDGNVIATNLDKNERQLKRADSIFPKDIIKTSEKSTARLRFNDGGIFELAENSSFEVKNYQFNKNDPSKDSFSAALIEGGFRTITGEIGARNPSTYEISARSTTLSIRGTGYYVKLPHCKDEAGKCSDIKVYVENGTVKLLANDKEYVVGAESDTKAFVMEEGKIIVCSKKEMDADQQVNTLCNTVIKELQENYKGGLSDLQTEGNTFEDTGSSVLLQGDGNTAPPPGGGGGSACQNINSMGASIP